MQLKNIKIKPLMDKAKKVVDVSARVGAAALKVAIGAFLVAVFTGVICFAVFGLYVKAYLLPQADIDVGEINMNLTSVVYYTDSDTGEQIELTRLHGSENRVWVNYSDIPQDLVNAVIAIEDERFESHKGVDWRRTIGAAANVIMPFSSNFGGSTITQQLVKSITSDDEITIQRKVLEILRALNLERKLSKEQIMEMYLNTINLSQGCYGVASAAYVYFGKSVSDLSLAECACLAGITNRPTYYDPLQNPDNNKERQELILSKMLELGKITKEEYIEAVNETLVFKSSSDDSDDEGEIQSYFVDMLVNEIVDQLEEQYGYSQTIAYKMLYAGGLKIYSTIDPDVQKSLEEVYSERTNFPTVKGTTQIESAMVVYSTDGYLRGIVGGIGRKTGNLVLNRALSKRQTGSSTKPVTVYAPALDLGLITPYSVFDDSPPLLIDDSGVIIDAETALAEGTRVEAWPANSNRIYTGLMTVKKGVADSVNTLAVRVLMKLTPQKSFEYATKKFGLDLGEEDIGYAALALGGYTNGVSLLDLTAAYVPFNNNGVYRAPSTYTQVIDSEGKVILDNTNNVQEAIKPKTAYYMRSMLEEVVKNGTATGANISGFGVAGKTGTTTKNYDRWFVGITPYYVAGVWYGYDINKEILLYPNPAVGTWKTVMTKLLADKEPARFVDPDGLQTYYYCSDSGKQPTDACRADTRGNRVATGKFFPEDAPTMLCDVHKTVDVCTATGKIATEHCPATEVKQVSLLNLYRYFAVPGITVSDEKYCVHYPGTLPENILSSYFPAVAYDGNALEEYCTVHSAPVTEATTTGQTAPTETTRPTGTKATSSTSAQTTQWEPPTR